LNSKNYNKKKLILLSTLIIAGTVGVFTTVLDDDDDDKVKSTIPIKIESTPTQPKNSNDVSVTIAYHIGGLFYNKVILNINGKPNATYEVYRTQDLKNFGLTKTVRLFFNATNATVAILRDKDAAAEFYLVAEKVQTY
jgi:hypothetical protein